MKATFAAPEGLPVACLIILRERKFLGKGQSGISPREHQPCPIGSDRALDFAIMTAPEARDPALLRKLDAVAGRVLGAAGE